MKCIDIHLLNCSAPRNSRQGADAVICQHSHSMGCAEYYKDSYIYGQGNFIFDANDNEYWNNGLIVVIV